ncbi:putative transcription factor C2H2 family [Dioscorea sansibarensis]
MGLSNGLSDASTNSIPLLLLIAATRWISSIVRSLRLFSSPSSSAVSASHGLASLIALAETLNSSRPFSYDDASGEDCLVCLCGLVVGDRVRRLGCGHVFHCDCLDGWLDEMNLSCPLCRSSLVSSLQPYH